MSSEQPAQHPTDPPDGGAPQPRPSQEPAGAPAAREADSRRRRLRGGHRAPVEPADGDETEHELRVITKHARIALSAVLAFALGLIAAAAVVSIVFSPWGIVFGLLGVLLGSLAVSTTRKPGVTGRLMAVIGVAVSAVALLIAIGDVIDVHTPGINDDDAVTWHVHQLEDRLD